MKPILMMTAWLMFMSQVLAADENSAGELARPLYANPQEAMAALRGLVTAEEISLASDPESMIQSGRDIAVTKGVWSDDQVARYRRVHGDLPLVLPLTRVMPQATNLPAHEDSLEMYYLFISRSLLLDQDGQLKDRLRLLISESFQQALADRQFEQLPPALLDTWKVKLGIQAPRFPGGYR